MEEVNDFFQLISHKEANSKLTAAVALQNLENHLHLTKAPPLLQRNQVNLPIDTSKRDSFSVVQWNILATALAFGSDNFIRCPIDALDWDYRKKRIIQTLLKYQPDIICLEEVDTFGFISGVLKRFGYSGSFLPKPNSPCLDFEPNSGPDGCAVFVNDEKFSILAVKEYNLRAFDYRSNQVVLSLHLEHRSSKRTLHAAATHFKAKRNYSDYREKQAQDLVAYLEQLAPKESVILCGDFNGESTEPFYDVMNRSSLHLKSAYRSLPKNSDAEPKYTSWMIRPYSEECFTIDYIWYTEPRLQIRSILDIPTEEDIGVDRLPSMRAPSDHLPLLAEFSFKEE